MVVSSHNTPALLYATSPTGCSPAVYRRTPPDGVRAVTPSGAWLLLSIGVRRHDRRKDSRFRSRIIRWRRRVNDTLDDRMQREGQADASIALDRRIAGPVPAVASCRARAGLLEELNAINRDILG